MKRAITTDLLRPGTAWRDHHDSRPLEPLAADNGWMKMHHGYAQITITVAVVWAIILILGVIVDRHKFSGTVLAELLMVFGGFVIGWVLATIAHARGKSTPRS